LKKSRLYCLREWLAFLLFGDVIEHIVEDADTRNHEFLDKLGVPHSRIQPDGRCYDGLHCRIRDALKKEDER